jgi:exosortase B
VLAGLLILFVPTFYDLATTIWQQDEYAHGPIILAIIIWLIWDRRSALLDAPIATAPAAGFALLVFGLLLYVAGRSVGITILEIGSLLLILGGALLAMRGWPALRAMWFTLLFTVYLVPLPGIFVDAVTGPLKQYVSTIAEDILYAAGYPVARSGVVLTVGQYQLLIADACSGLNSMFSISAIGLLYLYLMRYRNWLRNGLILASLLPIAFGANITRVIILVLVTYHYGDAAGQGFLHEFSGIVLFVSALIILLLFDAMLSRAFVVRRPAEQAHITQ